MTGSVAAAGRRLLPLPDALPERVTGSVGSLTRASSRFPAFSQVIGEVTAEVLDVSVQHPSWSFGRVTAKVPKVPLKLRNGLQLLG